jgi:hypothetical protein
MQSPYQAYYFAPLVSVWFLIIYGTMYSHAALNPEKSLLRTYFYIFGLFGACCLLWMHPWIIETLVNVGAWITASDWDAREAVFRFTLDIFIVPVGMLLAFIVLQSPASVIQCSDKHAWKVQLVSVLSLVFYFWFEMTCKDKYAYNRYHPFVSVIPVLAYIALRNTLACVRRYTSTVYRYVGQISLELFIAQFHVWLAMDTKGVLVVFPRWPTLNLAVTTYIFVYLAHYVSKVSGSLTDRFATSATTCTSVIVVLLIVVALNHFGQMISRYEEFNDD